jgi:hypothetical protein
MRCDLINQGKPSQVHKQKDISCNEAHLQEEHPLQIIKWHIILRNKEDIEPCDGADLPVDGPPSMMIGRQEYLDIDQ